MFTELKPLFRKGANDTILLSISLADDGNFIVGITPKLGDLSAEASRIINRPISINGTPEELDAEFHKNLGDTAIKLAGAVTSFTTLTEELEKAEAELKQKTTETKAKAEEKKKTAPPAPPAKPAAAAKPATPPAPPATAKPSTPPAPPAGTTAAQAPAAKKLLF